MKPSASLDIGELSRFSSCEQDWWNPDGAWRPLHKLNPARLEYIRKIVCDHFKKDIQAAKPFTGLSVLDIGCGGGLLSEPLANLGAKVTGLDASEKAINVAREHAAKKKLKISYIEGSAEEFSLESKTFDVILMMEILEHAADIGSLMRSAASLLKPDGIIVISTVNRTTKSFLLGIVVAEYILGWVPKGLHDWEKFIRPSELAEHLQKAGLEIGDLTGMVYNPILDSFSLRSGMVGVNYLATAKPISH